VAVTGPAPDGQPTTHAVFLVAPQAKTGGEDIVLQLAAAEERADAAERSRYRA
jgi:hypothetical protein